GRTGAGSADFVAHAIGYYVDDCVEGELSGFVSTGVDTAAAGGILCCWIGGQDFFSLASSAMLTICPGCYRRERLPGGSCTQWKRRRLFTAHVGSGQHAA